MTLMGGPDGGKQEFVLTERIRFHVAHRKGSAYRAPVAVRSFAPVPRAGDKLTRNMVECLALAHVDVRIEDIQSGTFDLQLLLEPSAIGQYSVFVYIGTPMDKDLYGAGWNVLEDAQPSDDSANNHQSLSNLVEVRVTVVKSE